MDLLHDRLVAGSTLLALVPLHRLRVTPAATYLVTSRLPVGSLDGVADAFAPLACPLAPADLFLDCLIDAGTSGADDPLDCVPAGADLQGALATLNHFRGDLLASGCRGEIADPGVASLEKVLRDQLVALAPTATQALGQAALPETVSQALAELKLSSELRFASTPASDRWIAVHVLRDATWADAGGTESYTVDLSTEGLPRISAADIPVTFSAAGAFVIGAHDFSLRFGRLTREAAGELLFAPHGLPGDSAGLVAVFTSALMDGHPGACDALDQLLCPAAGLVSPCLDSRCQDALDAMPAALDARLGAFDGGADLLLEGTAHPAGGVGPVADYLSLGQWTVGLGRAGARTSLVATFRGTPVPAELHQTWGEWTGSTP